MQHKKTAVASLFQMLFLKIQNVTAWSVFPNPVTYDNGGHGNETM